MRSIIVVANDVTVQVDARKALTDINDRLALALDAGHLGSYELNLPTGKMICNEQCKKNFGLNLTNICQALFELLTNYAYEIFGTLDNLKLRSYMTLFDAIPATFPVFGQVLDKFFHGERDTRTLELLDIK